jgi:hypothetical protein
VAFLGYIGFSFKFWTQIDRFFKNYKLLPFLLILILLVLSFSFSTRSSGLKVSQNSVLRDLNFIDD